MVRFLSISPALFLSIYTMASSVKTTGVAGGLHKPYKGVGQPRLKAHEKVRQSQHYYGLPPAGGGSLFALAYWLTRERVAKFFQADLVICDIFL